MLSSLVRLAILLAALSLGSCRPQRTAIVSLLVPAEDKVLQKYTNCLKVFVRSLRGVGYSGEIVVLSTAETPKKQQQQMLDINVTVTIVSKISAKKAKNRSLLNMLTKLHLWGMVKYDQVMFFDGDFVFLHNPVSAFDDCGIAKFCACADTGIGTFTRGRVNGNSYFNSGFMVIRPDIERFKYLTDKTILAAAEGTQFVDQDLLNSVFQNRWKRLDSKYNLMHVNGPIAGSTVAIHEKLWIMQQKYPGGEWIWNRQRDQVEALMPETGFAQGMGVLKRRNPGQRKKKQKQAEDLTMIIPSLEKKDRRKTNRIYYATTTK